MAIFEEILTHMDDKDHPQYIHPKKKSCSLGSSLKENQAKIRAAY